MLAPVVRQADCGLLFHACLLQGLDHCHGGHRVLGEGASYAGNVTKHLHLHCAYIHGGVSPAPFAFSVTIMIEMYWV